MKCEVCLELLEEHLDGELASADREQVAEHLIACTACAEEFATLSAEQQIFARYDREIDVPPFLWTRVAASVSESNEAPTWRTRLAGLFAGRSASVAGAIAILLLAITIGAFYLISHRTPKEKTLAGSPDKGPGKSSAIEEKPVANPRESKPEQVAVNNKKSKVRTTAAHPKPDQSDVFSSDLGYLDIDDRDTATHLEQTQILLRSIRNVPVSDGDEEIDVTYDKALSRKLLNENVVLRREAEMKAKFPTKTLLADLEPFLIDIANLPDHARPEELRAIKERVRKTEIVAALVEYQDRGTNNR